MPILDAHSFVPPKRYQNGHYNTFIPYIFGKVPKITYDRRRITLSDGDFLDLDYLQSGHERLAVVCHGLEGSSQSSYILHIVNDLHNKGYDVLCPNYRSCSGEMNRTLRMYNSGTTDDLHEAIVQGITGYDDVVLVGVSLGGNLVLKYMGEQIHDIPDTIKSVVAVSAPVHLSNASQALLKKENYIYQLNFLRTLRAKIRKKARQFTGAIDTKKLYKTFNLFHFDDYFTAPLFGYASAEDYYAKCMSLQFLPNISVPALILNAKDDPFLGGLCYPVDHARESSLLHVLYPDYGGHVGFATGRNDRSYMLDNISEFMKRTLV